jgi:hypothetical protein
LFKTIAEVKDNGCARSRVKRGMTVRLTPVPDVMPHYDAASHPFWHIGERLVIDYLDLIVMLPAAIGKIDSY